MSSATAPTARRPSKRVTPKATAPAPTTAPGRSRATRVVAAGLALTLVGTLAAGLLGATDGSTVPAQDEPTVIAPEAAGSELADLSDEELFALLEAQGLAIDPATGEIIADTSATPTP